MFPKTRVPLTPPAWLHLIKAEYEHLVLWPVLCVFFSAVRLTLCSYRTDAPLTGRCNIVMKVACCSDLPKPEEPEYKSFITGGTTTNINSGGSSGNSGSTNSGSTGSSGGSSGTTTKSTNPTTNSGSSGGATTKQNNNAGGSTSQYDDYEGGEEYYAVVKSKLLRIPLTPGGKY